MNSNFKNVLVRLILICILFQYSSNYAQNKKQLSGSIKGSVIDKHRQEPIPYATIVIKEKTKIITGGIANDRGLFLVDKIPIGTYTLEIQFIGYKTVSKQITISKGKKVVNLGKVLIEEDAVALGGIEITAERSTIVQKIDRKVINVGKDLTTLGASASDIMGNIPSVSINQDGEISLRGNENVKILIDGKPTNISSTDLLQQIPSNSIKKIELITNPSAKYNPEGMSGIINIILKKNTNLGFNGTVSSGVTFGKKIRFNNAINLNYKKGKVNFYGSYGNRFGEQLIDGTVTRLDENTNQLTKITNERTSHLFKIGIDYFINEKNTISAYTNQNLFKTNAIGSKAVTFFDHLPSNFVQLDNATRNSNSGTYNIDFKHTFIKEGHNIELEFDYNKLDNDTDNDFTFTGNSPSVDYIEFIDDIRTNTTINLDYVNPISENSKIEIGIETRLRRTDNSYKTSAINLNNSTFSYNRDIYSFYTTWSQNFKKLSYNVGIRVEDYNVNAIFSEVGNAPEIFKSNLFNFYPSGFLKYTLDEEQKNSYQLSFNRRIDRPSLNQINPIRQISTPQIIAVGNPSLKPQFTNSIELNYNRKLNKGNFSVGAFYRKIKDEINRIGYFDTNNPTLLVLDYTNFNSNDAYGFEFSANYKPLKWWSFNSSFDIYSRTQKGIIENENVKVNNTLLNVKINSTFKITKALSFQVFTVYSGVQKTLQYKLKENIFVNAGARYNFAKGKGTFSINFNDIFKTQRFAFEVFKTIKQVGEFKRDSQNIHIGLSYKFGGTKGSNLKRKKRDKNQKADKFL